MFLDRFLRRASPAPEPTPAPTVTPAATVVAVPDPNATPLRIGILSPLETLDPARAEDSVSSLVLDQVFETLYAPPVGDTPATPLLARGPIESVPSRKGATYRVPLKPGVVFSDGTPLTSESVAASFQRLTDFQRRGIRVRAAGDAVEFELPDANPNFVLALTQTSAAVTALSGGKLIGTGPYLLPENAKDFLESPQITLARNPRSHQRAAIPALSFHVYTGITQLAAAITSGEIDYTDVIPFETARNLDRSRLRLSIQKGHSTGFLAVNTERVPDAAVRRALLAAVDLNDIAQRNFEGLAIGYAAGTLLPPMIALPVRGQSSGMILNPPTLPASLTLLATWAPKVYLPHPKETVDALRSQFSRIGVDIRATFPRSRDEYTTLQERGAYDLLLAGWIADTPDPSDFYESMLLSTSVPRVGETNVFGNNVSRWKSRSTDELLAAFRRNPNETTNAEIVRVIHQEGLLLPLLHGKVVAVYSWSLRGLTVSPLGRTLFCSAEF